MLEQQNKTKQIISTIASPFATVSMILLIILSLLEYFRRGFVSLFLDFRIVASIVLVLWMVAIMTEESLRRRRLTAVLPTVALLAVLPILYKMTLPFGRLGLITMGAGVFVIIIIIAASVTGGSRTMNDER